VESTGLQKPEIVIPSSSEEQSIGSVVSCAAASVTAPRNSGNEEELA
jgi:hypothetical protein